MALPAIGAEEVRIPRIAAPDLLARETFNPADWSQAAAIGRFQATGARPIGAETTLLLQHDGKTLYAAWLASGTEGRAFPRRPDDILTHDEAVQIVLGTGAKFSSRIDFGGYENAFSEQDPVAHFYEFTVNKAGAVSRTYNETPLRNPAFAARVYQEPERWIAVMAIPLASIGLPETDRQISLYFNAFRFHNSVRYGWYLPAFGGYAALPFSRAELLEPEQNAARSIVAVEPVPVPEDKAQKRVCATDLAGLQIRYYHLLRLAAVTIPPDTTGRTLVLRRAGSAEEAVMTLHSERETALKLPLPADLPPGTPVAVELLLRNGDGDLTPLAMETVTIEAPPAWLDTSVAGDYLDTAVPRPWTAPEWRDGTAILAHAQIGYGTPPLPRTIQVKGRDILRAPIRLAAVAGGKEIAVNAIGETTVTPARIELESTTDSGLEVKSMIDFDGFITVRARLHGLDATRLEKLELHIPLAKGVAEYLIGGSTQQVCRVGEFGHALNVSFGQDEFWFGNVNSGISFACDRSPFFGPPDGKQVELAVNASGDADLICRFVTAPGQAPSPDTVFQFYLQPTPVRPEPVAPQRDKMGLLFEHWSDFQAYPDLAKMSEVKAVADQNHREGKNLYLYFGQVVATNSPFYKDYPDELYAPNRSMYYERAYDPGKGIRCYLSCMRSPARDLLLDGVEQFAEQAGIDGVYLDGPTVPFHCTNVLHDCDDATPVGWDDDYHAGRIAGQRAFLKRLRGIFDRRGYPAPLWSHTGGGFSVSTLSLCDFYYDGEHLARYRRGYLLDPDIYAISYSGLPFGFRGLFLPVLYIDSTLTTRQSMGWALPHGNEIPIGNHPVENTFFDVLRRDPQARFYGYWDAQPHIVKSAGTVQMSYYRGEREATIAVGNVRYIGAQTVTLDISGLFPGREVRVTPIQTPDDSEFDGTTLCFAVPEKQWRLFHVAPVENADPALLPETGSSMVTGKIAVSGPREFSAADWGAGAAEAVRLEGTSDAWVEAELAETLPADFTLSLRLKHNSHLRIRIDAVTVSCDPGGGWLIEGLNEFSQGEDCEVTIANYGRTYIRPDQTLGVQIAVRNSRISVLYDEVGILIDGYPQEIRDGHTLSVGVKGEGACVEFIPGAMTPGVADTALPSRVHPVAAY